MITLVVAAGFETSKGNLRTTANLQFRSEAVAAATAAIDQVAATAFTSAPTAESISVDINHDGIDDYIASVRAPACLQARLAAGSSSPGEESSAALGIGGSPNYQTLWDISATVTDPVSGAHVTVNQGIRVLLTEAQRNIVCP